MKTKTLIIAASILVAVVIGAYASMRVIASRADNAGIDPAKAVTRYADPSGKAFYGILAGINNAYLLGCEGGWLLVDTGYPGDYGRFKLALKSIGLKASDIKCLFITHAHDEHAGFVAALVAESGCRLIAPALAKRDLEAGQMVWKGKAITRRIALASSIYNAAKRRDMRFPPLSIGPGDILLDGDLDAKAAWPGLSGSFIATPGHSPDSYSLVLDDGRAFVGDAAMNYLNGLGADHRPIFVTDEAQVYASLERILAKGAKTLYTGHGPAFGSDEAKSVLAKHAR